MKIRWVVLSGGLVAGLLLFGGLTAWAGGIAGKTTDSSAAAGNPSVMMGVANSAGENPPNMMGGSGDMQQMHKQMLSTEAGKQMEAQCEKIMGASGATIHNQMHGNSADNSRANNSSL